MTCIIGMESCSVSNSHIPVGTIDVVNTLSMVASLIVVITYLLDSDRRKFPYHLPIFVAISAFGFHLGIFILTVFGHDFVRCDSDPGLCTVSGTLGSCCDVLWAVNITIRYHV